jgi:5-formyltetrahydrofolate cyclo-ligase
MLKSEIRSLFKSERNKISDLELNQKSQLICEIALNSFNLNNKTVSIFLPITKFKEVNTFFILNQLKKDKTTKVALPISNFYDNSLTHFLFHDGIQIEENKFGIPEPINGDVEVKNFEFDVVFVPLLAIDFHGYRVGYGKGFYDRFMKDCKESCIFIGLNIFDNQIEIDDINEYDIPLDYCISPNHMYKFRKVETSR